MQRTPKNDLDGIVAAFVSAGEDPLQSAVSVVSIAPTAIDHTVRADVRRIVRSVVPGELSDQLQGTTKFVSVEGAWGALPGPCCEHLAADAHVHSGGVSPPIVLLRSFLRHLQEAPGEGVDIELEDATGARLLIEPLVLALGVSAIALDVTPALRTLAPVLGMDATDLWPQALEVAYSRDEAILDRMRAGYNELMARVGYPPELSVPGLKVSDWVANLLDDDSAQLARGCTAALTLVHSCLVAPHRANLDLFVERFNLLRSVRHRGSPVEADRIQESVRYLLEGGRLKRLELRKTALSSVAAAEDGAPCRDSYASINDDIGSHATALQRVRSEAPDLVVQMPVSFFRHPPAHVEVDARHRPLRVALRDTMAVANGIARICAESEEKRDFIGSLDVAGPETSAPNWLFALAFEYLDRALESVHSTCPAYSIHAGEQFLFPLDGLRRVGEILHFKVGVSRVGHALSLSPSSAERGAGDSDLAYETLESLLWAATVEPSLEAQVEDACRSLGSVIFGPPFTPTFEELQEWYLERFSLDRMIKLGFVNDPARFGYELFEVEERIDPSNLRLENRVDCMLAATLVKTTFGGVRLNPKAAVPPTSSEVVRGLKELCYEACLENVRDRFRSDSLIESCPSSNISLGGARSFADHPLGEFKEAGLRVTINSDDPGLFGALVEDEIVDVYNSGVLGAKPDADGVLAEILEESWKATAPGVCSSRCDELVQTLASSS